MDSRRTIVLVDDLRSFVDGRSAEVARTSTAGVGLLDRYRDRRLDELWLDHDLGGDDTNWPVVEVLERVNRDGYRQLRRLASRWPHATWAVEGAAGLGAALTARLAA
ncbi:cyclic-phosphate processing receiver domain-containing protein [Micromonospora tarensis]|uniref:cyclic-phosphate processing receiver domain-containing protein n=1 Tax=Micromonospora tarensis TaxID=2806100 RepID=UPI00281525CE|nr:cyclic-phosphate processing receiver domain-containing protein [Micromonospora tarensis]